MSDRIRHLEEGLQASHSGHADQPHPLLQPPLLGIKSTVGLYNAQAAYPSEDRPPPLHTQDRCSSEDILMVPDHPPHPVQVRINNFRSSKPH